MSTQPLAITGPGGRPRGYKSAIERLFKASQDRTAKQVAAEVGCGDRMAWMQLRRLRIEAGLPVAKSPQKRDVITVGDMGYTVEASRIMWIVTQTETRLDVLIERVKAGVGVVPASEFARWLAFSGVLDLTSAQMEDGRRLREKTAELNCLCSEHFRRRGVTEAEEDKQVGQINKKLDLLLKVISGQ